MVKEGKRLKLLAELKEEERRLLVVPSSEEVDKYLNLETNATKKQKPKLEVGFARESFACLQKTSTLLDSDKTT